MAKVNNQPKKLSEVEKLRIRMDYRFSHVDETLQELKENDKKLDRVLDQSERIATQSDQIEELQKVVFAN